MNDTTTAFTVTDKAAQKIKEFAQKAGESPIFRVGIKGGGCSGIQFEYSFENAPNAEDSVFTQGDVTVLIDPLSFQYLEGATIDYKEDLMGSQFDIKSTLFKTTCGCGQSVGI